MTYRDIEESVRDGEPLELYKFLVGTTSFLYTASVESVLFNGQVYEPIAISRTEIDQNDEIDRAGLSIIVPRGTPVTERFRVFSPPAVMMVTIFSLHPTTDVYATIWSGRVLSCDWRGSKVSLACESTFSSQKRLGLRRNYQATCPHPLYGSACKVLKSNFKVPATITAVSGSTVTVSTLGGYAGSHFSGGFLTLLDPTYSLDTRFITTGGATMTLSHPFESVEVGDLVDMYPGCAHTTDACDTKFSNILNYGGFPYVPEKSPFGSTTVF